MRCAILVPWMLEATGALSASFEFTKTTLVVNSPGLASDTNVSVVVPLAYAAILIVSAILVASGFRRAERRIRDRLHWQTWQLGQLIRPTQPG